MSAPKRRTLVAMTVEEARAVLGFPAGATPSPKEINQAARRQTIQHHPDKGGDPEMMVEINVAKDVLLTGRPKRFQRRENPELERRRSDVAAIKRVRAHVMQSASSAVAGLSAVASPVWLDFREWVVTELVDTIDDMRDVAEDATKDDRFTDAGKKRAKAVQAACEQALSPVLRAATKYGAIRRNLNDQDKLRTVADIEKLYRLVAKFEPALDAAVTAMRKIITLTVTRIGDDEPHPWENNDDLDDRSHRGLSMLDSFAKTFRGLSKRDLVQLSRDVEQGVKEVMEVLKRYDLSEGYPDWKSWAVPNDFDRAVASLETRTKNARRVMSRYMESV